MFYVYMLVFLYLYGISYTDYSNPSRWSCRDLRSAKPGLTWPDLVREEDEVKYNCLPNSDQHDTVILMEFEQLEGDSSRLVIEPWLINHFRFACQRESGEWFTTSKDGFRQYLKKVWCNGFKKNIQRDAVIDELRKKIRKEHTEL